MKAKAATYSQGDNTGSLRTMPYEVPFNTKKRISYISYRLYIRNFLGIASISEKITNRWAKACLYGWTKSNP